MPGSHTLLLAPIAGVGSVAVDLSDSGTRASANKCDPAIAPPRAEAQPEAPAPELRLSAPPGDVARLLQRYGTSLPRYLDSERQRAVARSRLRWPILQGGAFAEPTA